MNDSPPNSVEVPRVSIDWYRAAPWWRIAAHAIGISWRASHLILCGVALVVTQLLTQLAFYAFQPEAVIEPVNWLNPSRSVPAMAPFQVEWHQLSTPLVEGAALESVQTQDLAPWFHTAPDSYLQVWRRLCAYPYQALELLTVRRAAYLLASFAVVLSVWTFVGGCLCRRSIQELGTRITSPWMDTVRLVSRRWLSIAWAITMPLALIALVCVIPLLLGWLSNIPMAGPWVAGLLMVPFVVLSVGLGWCASISFIGFPLSTAAIVAEKQADAFDGVSRAAAYTFQRPVTLILCIFVAEWVGHFAGSMVSMVLNTGYAIVSRAFGLGSFQTLSSMGAWTDGLFAQFVPCLVTAFGFSFFWTASSAIYLLLRREVDHAEFDLIDMDAKVPPKPLPELPLPTATVPTGAVPSPAAAPVAPRAANDSAGPATDSANVG
jgi:hypothetical protein